MTGRRTSGHRSVRVVRGVLVAGLAAAVLGGCGGGAGDGDPSAAASASPDIPTLPPPVTSFPYPSTTPAPAGTGGPAAGTDLGACRSGTCTVTVRTGDEIPLDRSARVDRLVVSEVGDGSVTVSASSGSGSTSSQSSTAGSENVVNGLRYRILSVDGDTAVLDLSTS